jgi:hypothetical protein
MSNIYQDVEPIIPNTTMQLRVVDGKPQTYWIRPIEGYELHDKQFDTTNYETVIDEEIGEEITTESLVLGYRESVASCSVRYDFSTQEVIDESGHTFTAYGNRQFFTKEKKEV